MAAAAIAFVLVAPILSPASSAASITTGSGGWVEVPHTDPENSSDLEAAWFDGTDVWTVGVGQAPGVMQPLIQRCGSTGCTVSELELPAGVRGSLTSIDGTSPTDIWVAGAQVLNVDGHAKTLVAHFDGDAWTVVPTPPGEDLVIWWLSAITVAGPDDVWAVGEFRNSGDEGGGEFSFGLVLHWDGVAWSRVDFPDAPDGCDLDIQLDDVLATSSDLFVSGSCWWSGELGFVLRKTETGWENSLTVDRERGVSLEALTIAGDDVWVVGRSYKPWPSWDTRAISFRLEDGAWSRERVSRRIGSLTAAYGTADGEVWAVGWNRDPPQGTKGAAARWSDGAWHPVRVGLDGQSELTGVTVDDSGGTWATGFQELEGGSRSVVLRRPPTP